MVDFILKALPYKAERMTVVAALLEFRGRVNHAIDYLMPGKGTADLSDSDPEYNGCFEDPPTPGEGLHSDLIMDEIPTLPYDSLLQPKQQLSCYVRGLEAKIHKLQGEVSSLKIQLRRASQQHR